MGKNNKDTTSLSEEAKIVEAAPQKSSRKGAAKK
jgi:hypothetical protein